MYLSMLFATRKHILPDSAQNATLTGGKRVKLFTVPVNAIHLLLHYSVSFMNFHYLS